MEIKKFNYNGKDREVLVSASDSTSVSGFDLSYVKSDSVRANLRENAASLSVNESPLSINGYENDTTGIFRKFSNSKIG